MRLLSYTRGLMSSPTSPASSASLELTTATTSVSQEMRRNSSDRKTSWEASTEASREASTSQSWGWETPRQDSVRKTWRKIDILQGEKSLQSREWGSSEVSGYVRDGTKSRHRETMMRNLQASRPASSSASLSPVPRLVAPWLHSLTLSLLALRLRDSFIFLVFIHDLLVLQSHLGQQSFGFLDGGVLTGRLLLVVIHRPAPPSQ